MRFCYIFIKCGLQNITIQILNISQVKDREEQMKQGSKKQYDYQYKFVMVGDSAVGKSSLLLRFADNEFNENYMITIGVDFRFKSVTVSNRIVKLQIWDTAGQERFRTIVNTYYKNSHAVYLIFDLSNKQSFNSIKNYWINQAESYTDQSAVVVLVGNKCDASRVVSQEEIKTFVESKQLQYFETSAKNSTNVNQMFISIAQLLTDRKMHGGKVPVSPGQEGARKLEAGQVNGEGRGGYKCAC